jgi:DNA-directed RNA polymerase specialized sigma24 family protein
MIERARQKRCQIHGGGRQQWELDSELAALPEPAEVLLALDSALARLAQLDPVKVRLVELRYFAGMTGEEAATVLGISARTADRYWVYARACCVVRWMARARTRKWKSSPAPATRFRRIEDELNS